MCPSFCASSLWRPPRGPAASLPCPRRSRTLALPDSIVFRHCASRHVEVWKNAKCCLAGFL
eukprot:4148319-Pyramimonas_sp.AAC.1